MSNPTGNPVLASARDAFSKLAQTVDAEMARLDLLTPDAVKAEIHLKNLQDLATQTEQRLQATRDALRSAEKELLVVQRERDKTRADAKDTAGRIIADAQHEAQRIVAVAEAAVAAIGDAAARLRQPLSQQCDRIST